MEREPQEQRHECHSSPFWCGERFASDRADTRVRESKLSRHFLLWLPVAPFVGFTLAETVFDLGAEGDWELRKAALLGALLMAPVAVGAYFGLRPS